MIKVIQCYPGHFKFLRPQDAQIGDVGLLSPAAIEEMCKQTAFSVWDGPFCVAALGIMDVWPGRGMAWAVLSEAAKAHLLGITRRTRYILANHPARRVETVVEVGFAQGIRWAKMLGMEGEGTMRAYMPNGNDAVLFATVKDR